MNTGQQLGAVRRFGAEKTLRLGRLRPGLALLFISLFFALNQNSFAAHKWDWRAASNDNIPFDAVVGGSEGGAPLYICRAVYNGGTHPGKVRQGFGGCKFGWDRQEITVANYEVLVPAWIAANGDNIPASALELGNEAPITSGDFSGPVLFGCRAIYQNGIHPGKVRAGFGGCKFGWGGQEITVPNYQVLSSGSVDYVNTGPDPILSGALAGGREGAGTLYICRAIYNKGLHPGKFRAGLGGCNIGWGDKEVTVPSYTLLFPHWEKSLAGGVEYEPGYEDGKPLYICRGSYENGIHPGKYRSELGGCNIGWGGKEITLTSFEFLARPTPPH